ncbi:hypothetical protein EDB80DRAFT_893853 [Ilyonectria destructans]|nr:hypothetical protein EDB80DRAFT_893853 [Ilyonectria destructans]
MADHYELEFSHDIALPATSGASEDPDFILDGNALAFNEASLAFDGANDWVFDDAGFTFDDTDLILNVHPLGTEAEGHFPSVIPCSSRIVQSPDDSAVEGHVPEVQSWVGSLGVVDDCRTQVLHHNTQEIDNVPLGALMDDPELGKDHHNFLALPHDTPVAPKAGKRFPSSALRVLKNWLMSHANRPYPAVRDVELLERRTGLSKQQILNWFSNARRRKKFSLSISPAHTAQSSDTPPLEIPHQRPPTPIVGYMNPLERWQNSPPEDDPANLGAIVRALSQPPTDLDNLTGIRSTNDRRALSQDNTCSVSSTGTSDSSRSSRASAYSHTSQASGHSLGYLKKARKRRKRANAKIESNSRRTLIQVSHPFQCTFCTETFKTKHNWQRHEQSLHLSLEQWQCSPHGPTAVNADLESVCVFCGLISPDDDHLDTHNYASCQEREREERTFYRKDHLIQHMRFMHNSQFRKWPMEDWKLNLTEEIRSRCGFCKVNLTSWAERTNHLAEHFKEGRTMADWSGDWGFENPVLDMLEHSVSPYLIQYERNSPAPFTPQSGAPHSPTNAFELIQLELDYFFANHKEANNCIPSNAAMQYEACCIVFGAEAFRRHSDSPAQSWLRDLIMSSEEITKEARFRPMKSAAKSRLTMLKIYGKEDIFENDQLESQLRQHVDMLQLLNFEVGDDELQHEAYKLANQMPNSSAVFIKLLSDLIYSSTHWLVPFRLRARLEPAKVLLHTTSNKDSTAPCPLTTDIDLGTELLSQDNSIAVGQQPNSSTFQPTPTRFSTGESGQNVGIGAKKVVLINDNNLYRTLTRELYRFVASAMSPLNPNSHIPTDEELQFQARWIMYDDDDPWNQTPADNPDWLQDFKRDAGL